ncbi:hypothetical protein [Arenicella chitinivorans]|nr:hypothetical protein [Arenicella chitinivorans]
MQDYDYLWPGIAAALLAFLFPVYWLSEFLSGIDGLSQSVSHNIQTLSLSDAIFVVLALLTIYVYLSLRRILNDQLNFKKVDILIYLMIAVNIIFLSTIFFDIWTSIASDHSFRVVEPTLVTLAIAIGVGSLIVAGILDILLAIILLRSSTELPLIWRVFAVLTLVQGVFELSVIFHFVVIIVFPASLMVLAAAFLRKPESVELV